MHFCLFKGFSEKIRDLWRTSCILPSFRGNVCNLTAVERGSFSLSQSIDSASLCDNQVLASKETHLESLLERLQKVKEVEEKLQIVGQEESVLAHPFPWKGLLPAEEFLVKSVILIGQQQALLDGVVLASEQKLRDLLAILTPVEEFYQEMGGLIGYHYTLLQFLHKPQLRFPVDKATIHAPLGIDFSFPSQSLREAIYYGVQEMDTLAEMYPIGGAADRLKLQNAATGAFMPAALLAFNGRTMLGKLIEDLQAREYLYYKVNGCQITLPVAMMTSKEKDNDSHIRSLCEENKWFFRPKDKFAFFCQPLVPVVNKKGLWVLVDSMKPLLKPGGHGVIWKLARDAGIFSWFEAQGALKAIVRQINNPISSEDYGLLAFSGYGLKEDKRFGFASCERQVKASEGIDVVVEEASEKGYSYTLTNIEYCDFTAYQIQDEPKEPGGKYSRFPSNTNLLFVDLPAVENALKTCPIPGMLVNSKKVVYQSVDGPKEEEVARLESTMQNLADCFPKHFSKRLTAIDSDSCDSYITFNKRRKTISATKKEYAEGSSFLETPEGCFLDVMNNMRELLEEHCSFRLGKSMEAEESFTYPSFAFYYHPALGPLYSLIGKKIRGGSLSLGSELYLHIAECDIENLSIEGSLLIIASRVMGEVNQEEVLSYSEKVGRCTLLNVHIQNEGIDYERENIFWKRVIHRKESCRIILEGASEFYAENVVLPGDLEILVEDGFKVTAKEEDGALVFLKEAISKPSWHWRYYFTQDKELEIDKVF
jgi:hypothetical protein